MSEYRDREAQVGAWRCVAATLSLMVPTLIGGPVSAGPRPSKQKAIALAWQDISGRRYGAKDLAESAATAFIFGSTTCPCADGYNPRIAALSKDYAARGVQTFLVFSGAEADQAATARYVSRRGITVPCVHDAGGKLAKRFGARATPTAVLVDSRGAIRYRGRIDDNPDVQAVVRHDLREALDTLLAGGTVRTARTRVVGCGLTLTGDKKGGESRPKLVEGIGKVEFPITSRSPEAQKYFNQAINRWFGFNFPEAEASFKEAARLDPQCGMAYWGLS